MLRLPGLEKIGNSHMKVCFKCGRKKELDQFYRHPQMSDGRLNKCKECTKSDVQKNYLEHIDHYREYERARSMLPHRVEQRNKYAKAPKGKLAAARAKKKYAHNNPIARAANIIVGNAVRDKRIFKMPCEKCGAKKVHAHHCDYAKPLEVIWLCPKHHKEWHKNNVPLNGL